WWRSSVAALSLPPSAAFHHGPPPPPSTLFPYTTLFRSRRPAVHADRPVPAHRSRLAEGDGGPVAVADLRVGVRADVDVQGVAVGDGRAGRRRPVLHRHRDGAVGRGGPGRLVRRAPPTRPHARLPGPGHDRHRLTARPWGQGGSRWGDPPSSSPAPARA